jgi:hypothetical protein
MVEDLIEKNVDIVIKDNRDGLLSCEVFEF